MAINRRMAKPATVYMCKGILSKALSSCWLNRDINKHHFTPVPCLSSAPQGEISCSPENFDLRTALSVTTVEVHGCLCWNSFFLLAKGKHHHYLCLISKTSHPVPGPVGSGLTVARTERGTTLSSQKGGAWGIRVPQRSWVPVFISLVILVLSGLS